ncbi:hypothetical protein JTE90_010280 [Oedothorax gibbosus]|uniref:Uncharacterized protein n=1 Tax=Oedothorax gibbosus TaxID=931172 RepID=A0AAV6TNU4_9ARAC|nr:hypothetical protein JTE90_010280 [Oedothorax gibbosus]
MGNALFYRRFCYELCNNVKSIAVSSFLEIFELITRTSTLYEASADEVEDLEDTLYNLLQSAFYDVIAERSGLVNPRATIDDSLLEKNTVRAFNAHVLNLGLFYIVEEFYKKYVNLDFQIIGVIVCQAF